MANTAGIGHLPRTLQIWRIASVSVATLLFLAVFVGAKPVLAQTIPELNTDLSPKEYLERLKKIEGDFSAMLTRGVDRNNFLLSLKYYTKVARILSNLAAQLARLENRSLGMMKRYRDKAEKTKPGHLRAQYRRWMKDYRLDAVGWRTYLERVRKANGLIGARWTRYKKRADEAAATGRGRDDPSTLYGVYNLDNGFYFTGSLRDGKPHGIGLVRHRSLRTVSVMTFNFGKPVGLVFTRGHNGNLFCYEVTTSQPEKLPLDRCARLRQHMPHR